MVGLRNVEPNRVVFVVRVKRLPRLRGMFELKGKTLNMELLSKKSRVPPSKARSEKDDRASTRGKEEKLRCLS